MLHPLCCGWRRFSATKIIRSYLRYPTRLVSMALQRVRLYWALCVMVLVILRHI
jgi:hypothetical protein